jgi:hypothetical protein
MNIGFISGHACIRCQKMAMPLLEKGYKVHMAAAKMPTHSEVYDSFYMCAGVNHYIEAIRHMAKVVDLFHVHNEPSWFVTAIKEHCDKPVVLDVHDSYLARMTPEEEQQLRDDGQRAFRVMVEERNNFQLADALVFPGRKFGQAIMKEFGLRQPSLFLPSFLPRRFYQYSGKEWMGGLVYEGRVDLKSQIEASPKQFGFRYCDYEDLAKECHFMGIDFHIYGPQTASEEFQEVYGDLAFLHAGLPYGKLLPAIGRHDWGLVGNVFETPEWDVAMPNKLFDYIAAGVPVAVINAEECARFVSDNGVGIVVNSIDELASNWSRHRECRANLIKKRQDWTMEKHIAGLEALYADVSS